MAPRADTAVQRPVAHGAMLLWNPLDLTWSERFSEPFEKVWVQCPKLLRKALATMAVFLMGLAMSGDGVVIYFHLRRQLGFDQVPERKSSPFNWDLKSLYLENLGTVWLISNLIGYVMFFGLGGFLHWFFYVRRRASAVEWKIQPTKWISREMELHEIKIGSLSLLVTGTFSALLGCYISNGGWSMVYYKWSDYGLLWGLLQWPVIFLYQDYSTYWIHRLYHRIPWLYKHFHKLHHAYHQPTAFSVTAIHPVEMLNIQMLLCVPLFTIPCHWVSFYIIALYTYYHGIIDHSGINFKAFWWQPWQPDVIFHDTHHQNFNVNYGFNCWFWDKLHKTHMRPEDTSNAKQYKTFYRSNY